MTPQPKNNPPPPRPKTPEYPVLPDLPPGDQSTG